MWQAPPTHTHTQAIRDGSCDLLLPEDENMERDLQSLGLGLDCSGHHSCVSLPLTEGHVLSVPLCFSSSLHCCLPGILTQFQSSIPARIQSVFITWQSQHLLIICAKQKYLYERKQNQHLHLHTAFNKEACFCTVYLGKGLTVISESKIGLGRLSTTLQASVLRHFTETQTWFPG